MLFVLINKDGECSRESRKTVLLPLIEITFSSADEMINQFDMHDRVYVHIKREMNLRKNICLNVILQQKRNER